MHSTPPLFRILIPLLIATAAAAQGRRQDGDARWGPDGKHVLFGGTVYDPLTWKEAELPAGTRTRRDDTLRAVRTALGKATGKQVSGRLLTRQGPPNNLPRTPDRRLGMRMSADRSTAAVILDGDLWLWSRGAEPRKLGSGLASARHLAISDHGESVSFLDGFDLFAIDVKRGEKVRLTKDGSENTFNGELDWVYQEEVYGRGRFAAAWWSPQGSHLAFLRIDERGVDTFDIVDHLPDQLTIEQLKYPKAGRTNPRATLHVARPSDGAVVAVDISKYPKSDEILIVRVGWTPQGDELVYMVQNREQTWLDLNFADPQTGASRTVIREQSSDSWVARLPMPRWLKDGTFLWESDRTGFRHFYRYGRDGALRNAVSQGEWSAQDVIKLDEERGTLAFYGHERDYVIGRHAYVATLDGSRQTQVTRGRGTHTVSFNGDGTLLLDAFHNLENPGEQWLRKAGGGDLRQIRAAARGADAETVKWHRIKARDGVMLDVTYRLPSGFDPAKKYPVWIQTYSGPASPSVRDAWPRARRRVPGATANDWYVVLQVNVRSASTQGMKYSKYCYRSFGVQAVRDLEDAIDWLCTHPWADRARVGISGWSFGGFMTAFAMTHSDRFKCGIAGAGVYDWRLYDTIYTERYMATPQHNREGYDGSSVVKAAKNLRGHLLLVHGTMDDNVHFQNTVQLVHALQQAGKQNFELMIYPRSRHGVGSRHLGALQQKFIRERL